MGKSPGKWIKTKLFGKKSSKSNLSKDATLDRKTSITSKAASNNFDDDSMVISSPVPPVVHASEEHTELKKTSSVNITSDTVEVVRSGSGVNTANEDELIKLEQAAIKTQTAFRGYLARRSLLSLKAIILLQAHIRGHLARKQLHAQKSHPPSTKGNLVISTEPAKPKPTLKKPSTHLPEPVPEQPHSELEKVKLSLRKISLSTTTPTPEPEPESKPKPEPESEHELEPEPESDPKSETEPEPEPATNVESNGKENLKTKRRKSFPVKQESHVECVMQSSPVLPSYMAATESAKAKLRAQAAEDGGENGFVRRHSLPSLSTGKLSLQSPRVQKPVQVNGKGWNKSNKAQICAKDDKTGWKR